MEEAVTAFTRGAAYAEHRGPGQGPPDRRRVGRRHGALGGPIHGAARSTRRRPQHTDYHRRPRRPRCSLTFAPSSTSCGAIAISCEISAPVDANLEAAEIHRRVIAAGGPALLFTNVRGKAFPLVTNLFGTARRAELAFGPRPLRLIKDLVHLAETLLPPTPAKLWGARGLGGELIEVGTRRQRAGAGDRSGHARRSGSSGCRCSRAGPRTAGPFVTLPLVYTTHPDGKGSNLGMYRLQVHDARTTGMHWQIGKGGGFHYQVAEARGEALPVTVFLGGPPALILAAIAPLPENVPEMMLASLIAGQRLPQVPGPNGHPHPLVATAEFALMGDVPPQVRRPEGPFGDHYGYYSLRHDYPEFRIQQIAHRHDAIYPATVVGKPRQEDFYIGDLLQELLSPLFPLVMPAVERLWSYGETGYHSLAAAVVKQRYKREAMASAFRILGEGQLSLTKFLFLTDRRSGPARISVPRWSTSWPAPTRARTSTCSRTCRWIRSTTPGRP